MEETRAEYRPVSRLAVAALGAGVLSALSLLSPICWVIPLVAIGLALAALGEVNQRRAAKAGGLAAITGLALAVGFGSQAVTSAVVSRWLVERRAAAAARLWIDAVRAGRIADAMSVCMPSAVPGDAAPLAPSGGAAAPVDATAREEAFAALPAVRALAACGAESPWVMSIAPDAQAAESWVIGASLAPCGRPEESLRIVVEPVRMPRQGGTAERWLVTGFALER